MKKRNDDFNSGIVFVSSVILVGLIVGVFASIITTATDKNDAKKQMSAVARYVNEQCILYEELAAEDASRSLYDVSDKAFAIRSALDYGAEDLAAEVRSQAEGHRLNGIFVTESTADSAVGRVVSYCSDGKDDATCVLGRRRGRGRPFVRLVWGGPHRVHGRRTGYALEGPDGG